MDARQAGTADPSGDAVDLPRAVAMARRVLERHWDAAHRYCAPNLARYRWQWLWDSCFHAVAWAALGDERGVEELRTLLAQQAPNGFVPHLGYQADPGEARSLWGVVGSSTITQPPMWGHALAVLAGRGMPVEDLVPAATAGLRFLFDHRRANGGLLRIVHPWESGVDDSPRWDAFCPGGFDRQRWLGWKLGAVRTLRMDGSGGALSNPAFEVCPASFNALVAFNAGELAALSGDDRLAADAGELAGLVADRWDATVRTWIDTGTDGTPGAADDTLDAQLALLVDHAAGRAEAGCAALADPARFGAPYGPCAVSRAHPAFDRGGYWRGPSWPQLTYLLWLATERAGRTDAAASLASALLHTTVRSGFAEYADPLSGQGLGAVPQSWAALCVVPALLS